MRRRRRWNPRCAQVNWAHGALFFVMLLHFRTDLPPFGPGTRRTRMGRPSRIARDPRPNRCSEERPMTQIRSLAQPVHRRPGELGVHSLDLFNFLVPDAAAAEKFYRSLGLDVREEQGKLNIYTQGHPHRWGSLVEGPRKKLNFISFGAFEDDLPRFRERLQNMRIDLLDPPVGFESNGLWFRDADGTLLEIRVAEKSSPNEKSPVSNPPGPAAKANAPSRSKAFFDGIDPSMEYAAMIDGCSRWGAFW